MIDSIVAEFDTRAADAVLGSSGVELGALRAAELESVSVSAVVYPQRLLRSLRSVTSVWSRGVYASI